MLARRLVNGIAVGSVYALFARGFTLVFGVHHILNLAHGSVSMWGAFIGLVTFFGLVWYLYRTGFGRQVRAVAVSEKTATLLGVKRDPSYGVTLITVKGGQFTLAPN